ncbi:MAG: OmpA family protein [Myxococcales bacterium]|nr:OmpA family protein [Myxococcales bacterium]
MTFLVAALLAQVNLSLLRPASGSDGFLGVEGAHPLTSPDFPLELQVGFDAAWLPVRRAPRVDRRLGGWVQLAARLNDDFQLFAQLPGTLREAGQVTATGFGVGDIRLGVRHGFSSQVAGQLSIEIPTAQPDSLTGDDRLVGEALVSAEQRRGQWQLLENAYLRFRPPRDFAGARLGNELGLRFGTAFSYSPRARAYGELEIQSSFRDLSQATLPIEWRAGATVCANGVLAFDAAFGTRLDEALGAPSARLVAAVRYTPSMCHPPKREGPEPGLQELVAKIAQERAAREAAQALENTLALLGPSESNARDAVLRAEAADLVEASEADALARVKAWADDDTRDSDGDGIPDRIDNCPHEKGPASNHGCPPAQKQIVVLREDRIDILDKVYFATARARIEKRSDKLLDQVARVLREHPGLLVEVQGHTDDRGSAVTNTALSQARAEAVVGALIRRGVKADRLEARGYGPSQPVAPNKTRAGREKNRRVEFHVIK